MRNQTTSLLLMLIVTGMAAHECSASMPSAVPSGTPSPVPSAVPVSEHDPLSPWTDPSEVKSFLADRFNRLELDAIVGDLRERNRKDQQAHEYVGLARFGGDGALLYNEEIRKAVADLRGTEASSLGGSSDDRTLGVQAMPFTVSVLSDGSAFVSAGLVGFRNGDSRENMRANNVARFVTSADFLTFEWDNYATFSNVSSKGVSFARAQVNLAQTRSHNGTRMFALTAGAGIGKEQARVGLDDGRVIKITGRGESGYAWAPTANLGLRYDRYTRVRGGDHLQGMLNLNGEWLLGKFRDVNSPRYLEAVSQYHADIVQYEADQRAWMAAHHLTDADCAIDPCFGSLVRPRPRPPAVQTENILGTSITLSPSVTYEHTLKTATPKFRAERGGRVRRRIVGATAGATIPFLVNFKGGSVNLNQGENQRDYGHIGIFYRF